MRPLRGLQEIRVVARERGVSGPSSSCVWNPRVFADDARGWQCPFVLCLQPQGCLRRGVLASGASQERTGESAQGAPRDPRRDSRGERSPWLPLETRPDSPGEPGMQPRASVVSGSVQPHRRQPTRLLCPWDSPGRNTGMGCHALLQGIFSTQLTWVSLTLGVGYLFMAAPAKRSHCSLPWTRGISPPPHLLALGRAPWRIFPGPQYTAEGA